VRNTSSKPSDHLKNLKFMSKKGHDDVRPVAGIPDDIMDKLESVAGDDEKAIRAAHLGHKQSVYIVRAARATRAELQELLLKGVVPALLRLALVQKDSEAKQWAGMMLASIGASIKKYDKKLCEANAAYIQEQEKIVREKQLVQVVVSPKPIMEAVRRELMKAEERRRTLLRLKGVFGRTWRHSENLRDLEDYLPFVELPDFPKRFALWWRALWPLIKENNPGLLDNLRTGKFPTRGIRHQSRWATYRPEFRNALATLARLRTVGVL
jgi:hypothetical protein